MLNYQILQYFILVLTFFPALMSITQTLHFSAHPNVPGTSTWPWDQVSSPNSLRNIIIILSSSTMLCQELYKDHQFLFFKGSKWVLPITPTVRPRAQLLGVLLQHQAASATGFVSGSQHQPGPLSLATVMAQSFWRKPSITFYLNQIHCLPGCTGKTVHKRHRLWI